MPAAAAELTISESAPVVDGLDQANLEASTGGLLIWSDRPMVGNTFTSGSQGGVLNAVTVRLTEGENAPIEGWKEYVLRIGTVTPGDPNRFDEIVLEIGRQEDDQPNDQYFTFTLDAPVTLEPDTLYGFLVSQMGTRVGWRQGIPTVLFGADDTFAGGQRMSGDRPDRGLGPEATTAALTSGDLVFHLDIEPAVPAERFAITEFDYAPGTDMVSLTWDSNEGESYAVRVSTDLKNWDGELDDDVDADAGNQTTREFDLAEAGFGDAGRVYIRVERLPGE